MNDNYSDNSQENDDGFQLPEGLEFNSDEDASSDKVLATSFFSQSKALEFAQLISLADGEGKIIFYPQRGSIGVDFEIGDVVFLREKFLERSNEYKKEDENGVIVQIVSLGTANYPQADTKALFRLMINVRSATLERSQNEPPEVVDEFQVAEFKVRASIVDGNWDPAEGRTVTRNVDIFSLDPEVLSKHIFEQVEGLDVNLGDFKGEEVEFFGGSFEKINLITGMKGAGKSHIAKGVISESLKAGMSAVVFDINDEYKGLDPEKSFYVVPGQSLRFRLDRIQPGTLLQMIDRLTKFSERSELVANSRIPELIRSREAEGKSPDIDYLISQSNNIFPGSGFKANMRESYESSLKALRNYGLIMTHEEVEKEDQYLKGKVEEMPEVISLSTLLHNIVENDEPGIIVFGIGGLRPVVQYTIVDLVFDTLKDISRRQTEKHKRELAKDDIYVPIYPTLYFEEAHMYMEPKVINELLPLIRHYGMNVFFITNTPGALPDSVFRLVDNLFMTRMLNKKDIDQVKNCGLADAQTIESFAGALKEHHALLLSGIGGATKSFPLVLKVKDFGLPKSGETRSMWDAMKMKREAGDAG